jgi:6-phosphofructokinase 2
MADVVTLTMNPAIDLSVSVERVTPFHKLRSSESRRDPGGGGINVARVLKRLGAEVTAIYPAGGTLGLLLSQLVDQEGISQITIPIGTETREDFTVNERATGFQYRFVLPGPQLAEHEWQACLTLITALEAQTRFVVCSGSLPPGVPNDFYRRVAEATRRAGRHIIVDSSGAPLKDVLGVGVYLLKPSLSELRDIFGAPLDIRADQIGACRALVEKKQAEVVALTLG